MTVIVSDPLQQEITALRLENEQLRQENENLRHQLSHQYRVIARLKGLIRKFI